MRKSKIYAFYLVNISSMWIAWTSGLLKEVTIVQLVVPRSVFCLRTLVRSLVYLFTSCVFRESRSMKTLPMSLAVLTVRHHPPRRPLGHLNIPQKRFHTLVLCFYVSSYTCQSLLHSYLVVHSVLVLYPILLSVVTKRAIVLSI